MKAFDFGSFTQKLYRLVVLLIIIFGPFTISVCAESTKSAKPSLSDIIYQAVAEGKIAYKLTTSDEFKAIAGQPTKEWTEEDGEIILMDYPSIRAVFLTHKDVTFTLWRLSIQGKNIDIGGMLQEQRQVIVKNIQDFRKIDLRNVDLRNLNLANESDYLKKQEFDSLTQWPDPEKLPTGFDPKKMLEEGKNPGLGIRSLHEQGINGKGIGIAILDQPLLLGHEEYTSRLLRYDATKASWLPPKMHGSPIAGIAVGKTCGVAPRAFVFYYAAGTTSGQAQIQADWINEIIKYNETNPKTGRIRVISISASPDRDSHFREVRRKAHDAGILVVTCSRRFLDYGNLELIEGKDPDDPESYTPGDYSESSNLLRVPTGNKTIATHQGNNVYGYERGGGMSWAAPYIAGLAALAFQVNPDVQPDTIVEQLVKTATHTKAGPVVNPRGFIESIRSTAKKQ